MGLDGEVDFQYTGCHPVDVLREAKLADPESRSTSNPWANVQ